MNKSLINPFELLGIDEQSTLKDARKSYYNLAMICHPDQGGDEKNMKILANAYKFVELQLKSVNNVNQNIGEDLEKEFERIRSSSSSAAWTFGEGRGNEKVQWKFG